ncbi:MAG: C39 family peptidase, partial [Candidatus Dormibacteria bacterium]
TPSRWSLMVPYTPQAPYNNWSGPRQNACEEAALLMVHDYLRGDTRSDIPADEADAALGAMQQWQVDNWAGETDLTMVRTGQLARAYYGHSYQVQPATTDAIMAAIRAGSPVSVPVMTHSLNNPNYGPQDVYHVLLIIGYDQNGVITNDSGVMQGQGWVYSWATLFQAIDAQTLQQQGRVMLTVAR